MAFEHNLELVKAKANPNTLGYSPSPTFFCIYISYIFCVCIDTLIWERKMNLSILLKSVMSYICYYNFYCRKGSFKSSVKILFFE